MALKNVDLTMKAAIYNGLFNTNSTTFDITPDCSTGNCTFPEEYQSLGVCSQCVNVTNLITSTTVDGSLVVASLPNGLSITEQGSIMNMTGAADLTNFKDFGGILSTFSSIVSETTDSVTDPTAAECVLYFCVKTFQATVQGGVLTETVTSTWYSKSATNPEYNYTLSPPACSRGENCSFNIDVYSFDALGYWLPTLLTGSVTGDIGETSFSSDVAQALYTSMTTWDPALNNYNPYLLNATMANLATSMTNNIRQYNYGGPASGVAWKIETVIEVRWAWMALPLSLVLLTVVFLVAAMLQSAHQQVWKSSSLALLFHGLGNDVRSRLGPLEKLDQMVETAGQVNVRLRRTDEGRRFID